MSENIDNYNLEFPFEKRDSNDDEESYDDLYTYFFDNYLDLNSWSLKKYPKFDFEIWYYENKPMPNKIDLIELISEKNDIPDHILYPQLDDIYYELQLLNKIEKLEKQVKTLKKKIKELKSLNYND